MPIFGGAYFHLTPVRFWPDHFFTQLDSSKKTNKLVGFDQCGFTTWQRKSSKYSNNAATVTQVSLQPASDNRSSVVSSTVGLPTEKSKVHQFQICCARTKYLFEIHRGRTIIVRAAKLFLSIRL